MSRVQLIRFAFERLGYPQAACPALPQPRPGDLLRLVRRARNRVDFRHCLSFLRARYALHHALVELGAGTGSVVLLPSYHCRTMLEPVLRSGAEPAFYRLGRDLAVDPEDLASHAQRYEGRVACVVITHFFGFRQAMGRIMPLLDALRIPVIEDCAHMLFDRAGDPDDRLRGACAVYSIGKLLPAPDGGLLCSRDALPADGRRRRARGARSEAGMLLRLLSAAWDQHRWRAPPNRASNDVPDKPEPPDPADERPVIDTGFVEDGHSSYYDPRREDVGASFWSMRMLATADTGSIGQARRRNFQTWLQAVSGLQHCRPLSGSIAADQVPYMFPLILERPEEHFDALKRAGLPIYRWDELAESDCETARYYRLHLLQLPCHQSLRPEAMKWMMSMVRHVLAGEPGPGARR